MFGMVSLIPQLSLCHVLHALAFCLSETKHRGLFLQKHGYSNSENCTSKQTRA